MNLYSVTLFLNLDWSKFQILDKEPILVDPGYLSSFRQTQVKKDTQFQFPQNTVRQIYTYKGKKYQKISEQQQLRDQLTQIQPKQYKKKKITKKDKFHIKQKTKQKIKIKKNLKRISRTQQKRKRQLQNKSNTFRQSTRSQKNNKTGKKQPRQLIKNIEYTKAETVKKSFNKSQNQANESIRQRKNYQMRQLENAYADNQQKRSTRNAKKMVQSFDSIQGQDSSFSEQVKSKKWSKSKQKLKKKYTVTAKNNNPQKFFKSSYSLQDSVKKKILYAKFDKQVLGEVPGRKEEAERIFQTILSAQNGSSTPICLHGNTGCGKTSLITKMLNFIMKEFPDNFSTAYLNCMTMWSVNHVYSGILYKLFGFKQKRSERALDDLFKYSQNRAGFDKQGKKSQVEQKLNLTTELQKTKIIVLDQIDHFIKDQTFIYNLLEWTHVKNSKIILIMISNILDLSVNLSSKIQSRLKFESLVFKPYSHDAIEQILKFKEPHAKDFFEPKAISFMCRKVASINSDIRLLQKIYDDVICQWSQLNGLSKVQSDSDSEQQMIEEQKIDIYEQEQEAKISSFRNSRMSKSKNMRKLFQLSRHKKITISQVQKSLFLTGELNNQQLPQILKQYEVILKVLHKAKKKQQVSYELMNRTYMKQLKMPSSQQLFLLMCELKDMGLIEIKQSTRNCDVTFQGFGIKIKDQLHLVCPQQ